MHNNSQGLLIVLSAPMGTGKDAIIRGLLKKFPTATKLVTTTTRDKRPEDMEGKTYFFISTEEFKNLIAENALVEYNFLNNNYYGIQKKHLQEFLKNYPLVFAQIDVHGRDHLNELGIPHTSLFILPQNLEILRKRAEIRGGMTEEMITERLQVAHEEMQQAPKYDYQIINHEGKLNETIENIAKIIQSMLK
jgi:guanylate kinase